MARLIPAGAGTVFRAGPAGMAVRPGAPTGSGAASPQDALAMLKLAEALGGSEALGALLTGVGAGIGKVSEFLGGGQPDLRAEAARRLSGLSLPPQEGQQGPFRPAAPWTEAPAATPDEAAALAQQAAGLPGAMPPAPGETFPALDAGAAELEPGVALSFPAPDVGDAPLEPWMALTFAPMDVRAEAARRASAVLPPQASRVLSTLSAGQRALPGTSTEQVLAEMEAGPVHRTPGFVFDARTGQIRVGGMPSRELDPVRYATEALQAGERPVAPFERLKTMGLSAAEAADAVREAQRILSPMTSEREAALRTLGSQPAATTRSPSSAEQQALAAFLAERGIGPGRQQEFGEAEVEPYRTPVSSIAFGAGEGTTFLSPRAEAARRIAGDPFAQQRQAAMMEARMRATGPGGFPAGQVQPTMPAPVLPRRPLDVAQRPEMTFTREEASEAQGIPLSQAGGALPPGGGGELGPVPLGMGGAERQAKIDAVVTRIAEGLAQGASGADVIATLVRRGASQEEARAVVQSAQQRAVAREAAPEVQPPAGQVIDERRMQEPGATPATAARPMTEQEALTLAAGADTPEKRTAAMRAVVASARPRTAFDMIFGTHRNRAAAEARKLFAPSGTMETEAQRALRLASAERAGAKTEIERAEQPSRITERGARAGLAGERTTELRETRPGREALTTARTEESKARAKRYGALSGLEQQKLEAQVKRLNAQIEAEASGESPGQRAITARRLYENRILPLRVELQGVLGRIRDAEKDARSGDYNKRRGAADALGSAESEDGGLYHQKVRLLDAIKLLNDSQAEAMSERVERTIRESAPPPSSAGVPSLQDVLRAP